MGYKPTNWKKGDVVTAEKLNKLENGIVAAEKGVFYVNATVGLNGLVTNASQTDVEAAFASGDDVIARIGTVEDGEFTAVQSVGVSKVIDNGKVGFVTAVVIDGTSGKGLFATAVPDDNDGYNILTHTWDVTTQPDF